jgi:hypothetical protein
MFINDLAIYTLTGHNLRKSLPSDIGIFGYVDVIYLNKCFFEVKQISPATPCTMYWSGVPTDMGLDVDPPVGRCLVSIILVWVVK